MGQMKRTVVQWKIEDIYKKRDRISFPDFQRQPKLWSIRDKQLLIDSILINMDIPKLYFNVINEEEYEVVDGQQRLWAIWEFIDSGYPFKAEGGGKKLNKLGGKKFKEFPKVVQNEILSYKLQITHITNASEKDLRELFLRLQLGLLLVTGEKLHAYVGLMKDFIFKEMVKHPFFKSINIAERRFAKQTLCAQICINSFTRKNINEFSRTRFEDLKYFFKEYEQLERKELKAFKDRCEHVISVLDILNKYFGEKSAELRNRSFILSTYLFVEELIETTPMRELNRIMPVFVDFSMKLLTRLKEEAKAGFNRKNENLYIFESYLSNAPGEKYQIERRHEKLKEFFKYFREKGKIKGDK
jgi:hypothetical protein